jgi:hypothetical protein
MAVDELHAIALPTVSNVVFTVDAPVAGDLQVTYNLKVDGVNTTDFTTVQRDYRTQADGTRFDLGTITAATSTGNGNYSITIPGGAAAAGTASRYMFRIANPAGMRAVVVEDFPAAPWTDAVSNQGCINCHGETGIFQIHGGGYSKPAGMEVCTVCHKSTAYDFEDPWFGIIHGVHNSHNMPSGHYEYDDTHIFSVTYPTYMTNCSVCHEDADATSPWTPGQTTSRQRVCPSISHSTRPPTAGAATAVRSLVTASLRGNMLRTSTTVSKPSVPASSGTASTRP